MSQRETRFFASWAERQRASNLAWIGENLHVFWPVARQGHEDDRRGAIVVDTTQRRTREGHPFGYFAHAMVEQTAHQDVRRMVIEYDPSWEIVAVLLEALDRVSVHRIGVLGRNLRDRDHKAASLMMWSKAPGHRRQLWRQHGILFLVCQSGSTSPGLMSSSGLLFLWMLPLRALLGFSLTKART